MTESTIPTGLPMRRASCQLLLQRENIRHGTLRMPCVVNRILDDLFKSNILIKWRRRYVVLHGGCLYVFKDEMSSNFKFAASLYGYTNIERCLGDEVNAKILWSFKLVAAFPQFKSYYFSGTCEADMKDWIDAVHSQLIHVSKQPITLHLQTLPAEKTSSCGVKQESPYHIENSDDEDDDDDDDDKDKYEKVEDFEKNRKPGIGNVIEKVMMNGIATIKNIKKSSLTGSKSTELLTTTNLEQNIESSRNVTDDDKGRERPAIKQKPKKAASIEANIAVEPKKVVALEAKFETNRVEVAGDYEDVEVRKSELDRCYWKSDISRAERLLDSRGKQGSYFIRAATTDPGAMTLVVYMDPILKKFRIEQLPNGNYRLQEKNDLEFESMDHLLKYYRSENLPKNTVKLTIPVKQWN